MRLDTERHWVGKLQKAGGENRDTEHKVPRLALAALARGSGVARDDKAVEGVWNLKI